MSIALSKKYKFTVLNQTGQTLAISAVKVYGGLQKIDTAGAPVFAAEATLFENTGGTIANGAFLTGTEIDNSTDKYIGGEFVFEVTAPASSSGKVSLYLDSSPGTTYPDQGLGRLICQLDFTATATKKKNFSL